MVTQERIEVKNQSAKKDIIPAPESRINPRFSDDILGTPLSSEYHDTGNNGSSRNGHKHPEGEPAKATRQGIKIEPMFCPEDVVDPFETVQWEKRTATIKGDTGGVFFEQND